MDLKIIQDEINRQFLAYRQWRDSTGYTFRVDTNAVLLHLLTQAEEIDIGAELMLLDNLAMRTRRGMDPVEDTTGLIRLYTKQAVKERLAALRARDEAEFKAWQKAKSARPLDRMHARLLKTCEPRYAFEFDQQRRVILFLRDDMYAEAWEEYNGLVKVRYEAGPHEESTEEFCTSEEAAVLVEAVLFRERLCQVSRPMQEITPEGDLAALLDRYKANGGVIDYVFLQPMADAAPTQLHRDAALAGMVALYHRQGMLWLDETRLEGQRLSLSTFLGMNAGHRMRGRKYQKPSHNVPNDCFNRYPHAFFHPPYGLQGTDREKMDLFAGINRFILGNDPEQAEIFSWSTHWSSYFERGHSWWGAYYWTVRSGQSSRFAVLGASSTD